MNKSGSNQSNRLMTVVILLAITLVVLLGVLFAQKYLGNGIIASSPSPSASISPSPSGPSNLHQTLLQPRTNSATRDN